MAAVYAGVGAAIYFHITEFVVALDTDSTAHLLVCHVTGLTSRNPQLPVAAVHVLIVLHVFNRSINYWLGLMV